MKRWIAMLLTVCMLFSLCPVGAFAEPATGGTEPAQTVQTEQDTADATGATNEEPKAETKTCSCKDLCDMQHPNADCEVCANSNDVGTCCKGSVAKVDAVDPQPTAEEEDWFAPPAPPSARMAMSTIVARPARPILPSAALWKTIRPWSIPMSSMWKASGRMPGHRALRKART